MQALFFIDVFYNVIIFSDIYKQNKTRKIKNNAKQIQRLDSFK